MSGTQTTGRPTSSMSYRESRNTDHPTVIGSEYARNTSCIEMNDSNADATNDVGGWERSLQAFIANPPPAAMMNNEYSYHHENGDYTSGINPMI